MHFTRNSKVLTLIALTALSSHASDVIISNVELGSELTPHLLSDKPYPSGIDRFLEGHELDSSELPFHIEKTHAFVTPVSKHVLMITMRSKINSDSCDSYSRTFENYIKGNFTRYVTPKPSEYELTGKRDGISYFLDHENSEIASYGCVYGEEVYFTASFQDSKLWSMFDKERDFVATSLESNQNKE